jgi:hypothetical protein
MSGSSEGRASVPVSVVQEGHKLSVTGAEWEEGGGYSLHVEVPHRRGQLLQRPCQVQHPDRGLIIIIRTIDEVYIFLVFHMIVLSN